MVAQSTLLLTDVVRHEAKPLPGEIDDYDPLLKMIGDARLELTLRNHGSATTALREPKLDRANFRMGSGRDSGNVSHRDLKKGNYNANKTDSKTRMARIFRSFQPST